MKAKSKLKTWRGSQFRTLPERLRAVAFVATLIALFAYPATTLAASCELESKRWAAANFSLRVLHDTAEAEFQAAQNIGSAVTIIDLTTDLVNALDLIDADADTVLHEAAAPLFQSLEDLYGTEAATFVEKLISGVTSCYDALLPGGGVDCVAFAGEETFRSIYYSWATITIYKHTQVLNETGVLADLLGRLIRNRFSLGAVARELRVDRNLASIIAELARQAGFRFAIAEWDFVADLPTLEAVVQTAATILDMNDRVARVASAFVCAKRLPTPTATKTTFVATATARPSATPSPTTTGSASPTPTVTRTPTRTPSNSPTPTATTGPCPGECAVGQTRSCTTPCGSTGIQTCSGSCSWGSCVPPHETCNGRDDNCDGIIDDYDGIDCWQGISRFQDASRPLAARCLGPDLTPPPTCAGYTREIEAFVVARSPVPGTYRAVQCSKLTDHILVEFGSADHNALAAASYDCSLDLGYIYRLGQAPPSGTTPFANTCQLWRFRYTVSGTALGAHLFTRGADLLTDLTCEPPARGQVFTNFSCFAGTPAGCS